MPVRRTLACTLAALLLTACTDTQPTESTTNVATTTTAAAEPALELGDFDPEGTFTVFDPCTEIPADVLAEAGLGEAVGEPYYDGNRSAMCSFRAQDGEQHPGVFSMVGDRNPKEKLEERGARVEEVTSSRTEGVYVHSMPGDTTQDCYAAVHTVQGRFGVAYGEALTGRSWDDMCEVAIGTIDNIVTTMGERNGNLH